MNLLWKIETIDKSAPNEAQLDKFLDQVRDSYENANLQFIRYQILLVISIIMYHLIVYGGGTLTVFGIQIKDHDLFRRTFMVFPAFLIAAISCIGYLRILQRETYDFLTIPRVRRQHS